MAPTPYGKFNVGFKDIAVSASQDYFELVAPSDAIVAIERLYLSVVPSGSDESLTYTVQRITGAPTSGSGGSAVTPQKMHGEGGGAAGTTGERNNTTKLTGGTVAYDEPFVVGNRIEGFVYIPDQEIILSPGNYFVWRLESTPSASVTVAANVWFSEYGG